MPMKIMNLAELLDSSVFILRKYSKSFIIFNLGYWTLVCIALLVLLIVMTLGIAGSMIASGGELTGLVALSALAVILGLTMGLCNSVGAIQLASQEVLLIPQDAAKAISASLKSTFRVMGLVFLGGLPMLPLGYGLWKLMGGFFLSMTGKSSEEMVTALGSADQRILFTILAILMGFLILLALLNAYLTLFTYALQALVLEKLGPLGAIRRSMQLVRGRFWYLYGAISLIVLMMSGISFSLDSFFLMISGFVELGMHFAGIEPGLGFTFVYVYGRGIANFLYVLLFNSLGAVVLTQLYYNRIFETEGADLILRVSRLASAGNGQEEP